MKKLIIILGVSLSVLSTNAFAQVDLMFSCHWASDGDKSLALGTGWEKYPDELLLTIKGSKAKASANGPNAGPVYEGEHNNSSFDGRNFGFEFPSSLAYRAKPQQSMRRFIYVPEAFVTGSLKEGQVVLYVSNPLKQWAFVYFDCEIRD